MAETWEDCVALLRAGASPSEVLPKLRELIHSEPLPSASEDHDPADLENSQLSSICCYKVNDLVLQLPFSQPPPTLWQDLANYSDEPFFDSEATIDVLQEFPPIIVGPPETEICEMLKDLDLSTPSDEICNVPEKHSKEDDVGNQFESVQGVLHKILMGKHDGEDYEIPLLSETEWAWVLSNVEFDGAKKGTVLELVGLVNQRTFSRVILHSIVPVLANELEVEDLSDLISTIAVTAEIYTMPHQELLNLIDVYRGIESKGALAQLEILCCGEAQ